ncbi:hypothetical protein WN51_12282 [Melipona quadrifasciata]|uniref:Uncharacterized protein n=1 Tax=Melipona quadrifasciata TaxID=166423 RepID=A0A0N0BH10_9HYME|nr:hypothetical protein WN51_12282 [Melipona quadrifasciata]
MTYFGVCKTVENKTLTVSWLSCAPNTPVKELRCCRLV